MEIRKQSMVCENPSDCERLSMEKTESLPERERMSENNRMPEKRMPSERMPSERMRDDCADACGILPANARLANVFVPFQRNRPQTYPAKKGVVRGTLFPGLDLPFRGMINDAPLSETHLHELQTLGFALVELGEYLDTHADDKEAFELFQSYAKLYRQGLEEYERMHGPLTQRGAAAGEEYQWLKDPWPWDYAANGREE